MASLATWTSLGALFLGALIAAACTGQKEKFPPPDQGTMGSNTTYTQGAGPGGGGGTAGGGGTTGSGGSGAGAPLNFCECAYSFTFDTLCGNCVNDAANGACKGQFNQCSLKGECLGLINCPSYCFDKPEAEKTACIQDCLVPFLDDEPHNLYSDFMTCVCQTCQGSCAPQEPIVCE